MSPHCLCWCVLRKVGGIWQGITIKYIVASKNCSSGYIELECFAKCQVPLKTEMSVLVCHHVPCVICFVIFFFFFCFARMSLCFLHYVR